MAPKNCTLSSTPREFVVEHYRRSVIDARRELPDGKWGLKIVLYGLVVTSDCIYPSIEDAFRSGRQMVDALIKIAKPPSVDQAGSDRP